MQMTAVVTSSHLTSPVIYLTDRHMLSVYMFVPSADVYRPSPTHLSAAVRRQLH